MKSLSTFVAGAITGGSIIYLLTKIKRKRRSCKAPRRCGGAIKLKPEMYELYTQLHDAVWEEVLECMSKSNIRNFTIYYHRETETLFSHFEWIGGNQDDAILSHDMEEAKFQMDMERISNDPIVKTWWSYCEPCQKPFSQWISESQLPSKGGSGDWWSPLICLCHCGHWPVEYSPLLRDDNFVPKNPHGKTSSSLNPPSSMYQPNSVDQ